MENQERTLNYGKIYRISDTFCCNHEFHEILHKNSIAFH